jgi:hypothetical protein
MKTTNTDFVPLPLNAQFCTDPKWVALKVHRAELGNLHRQVLIAQEWWNYCDHFAPAELGAAEKSLMVAMNNYRIFKQDSEVQISEIYTDGGAT